MADRACVARSVLSEVERGRRQPNVVTLQRLVAGAGFAVELRLFRPDPFAERLVGPIGRRVLERRADIIAAVRERGLGRVWVTGAVATGDESWDTRLVLVIAGVERLEFGEQLAVRGALMAEVGLDIAVDVVPVECGSADDVLLDEG